MHNLVEKLQGRLLKNPATKSVQMLAFLLVVALALAITMLLSIGKTGKLHDEGNNINELLNANNAVKIQYGNMRDATASYMFLGSEETWNEVQRQSNKLLISVRELRSLVQTHFPSSSKEIDTIVDKVVQYQAALPELKAIRGDSRGVIAGVLASNLTQSAHSYGFSSELSTAIEALTEDEPDISANERIFLEKLLRAHALWMRVIAEFRAQLLLRNPGSLTVIDVYVEQFKKQWKEIKILNKKFDIDFTLQEMIEQADIHQRAWIKALPAVIVIHNSKRWRRDLKYLEDVLNPISASFLSDLDRFDNTLETRQKEANQALIDNERNVLLWTISAMTIGTLMSIGMLFIFYRLLVEHRERRTAAEQASQLKTEFLSRVSHELRTPMNAILGFAQLIELDKNEPLTPSQQDRLQEILNGGHHLLELINEILDLTQIESGKFKLHMKSVALDDVLRECFPLINPLIVKHNTKFIDTISNQPTCHVMADRIRLKQVLINLLSNAIKYNSKNGTVTLACDNTNGRIRISIIDTGIGVSTGQQASIFQPFERLGRGGDIEGSGIGLAVTKALVQAMNGRIGVISVPNKGSTFWLELDTGDNLRESQH